MALVIFDLDGTLIRVSSERRFFLYLLKNRYFNLKQAGCYLKFLIKYFKFRENKAYLKNFSQNHIEKLVLDYFPSLIQYLQVPILQRLKAHQENQDKIVLLSGTLQEIADQFGDYLDISEIIATLYSISDYVLPTRYPFGEEKLKIAITLCDKYHTSLDKIIAYGNSIHDANLLLNVGKPIAVSPDRKLLKLALQKNWEIIK